MQQPAHLAGQKIRAWREAHGLTAEALGERLDPARVVSAWTIYNWERLGKVARPKLQLRLADMGICSAADWLAPAVEQAA